MFERNKLYFVDEPPLAKLALPATWATWRSTGRGPVAVCKVGTRLACRGAELNHWLHR